MKEIGHYNPEQYLAEEEYEHLIELLGEKEKELQKISARNSRPESIIKTSKISKDLKSVQRSKGFSKGLPSIDSDNVNNTMLSNRSNVPSNYVHSICNENEKKN